MTLTAQDILDVLDSNARRTNWFDDDTGAETDFWPRFCTKLSAVEYHSMRLIAVRQIDASGWGVVIERVQGDEDDQGEFPAHVARFCYGSGVDVPGFDPTAREPARSLDLFDEDPGIGAPASNGPIMLVGPAGATEYSHDVSERADARPYLSTAVEAQYARHFVARVRCYLARYPKAFWDPPLEVARQCLGLKGKLELIASCDAFEHVVGPYVPDPPALSDWSRLPSESPTYLSLAESLVARSPDTFAPGPSNLDFRLHAVFPVDPRFLLED